jgi:hypothetical protein
VTSRSLIPTDRADRLALGLTLGTLLWAGFVHHGIGPSFRRSSWIEPSTFLLGEVPGELLPALAVLVFPSLALAIAVLFLTRSSLIRTLAGVATVASASFVLYGVEASTPWRFFHWRWSASVALFAVVVGGALYAPLLAASWRQLGWPLRLATYLPVVAFLVFYETSVTGTNPELSFAVSPWPIVQLFALEFIAVWIAALWLGVGLGLLGVARGGAAVAVGILVAGGAQWLAVSASAAGGALLFKPEAGHHIGAVVVALSVLGLTSAWPPRDREALGRRGTNVLLGGVLLAAPLVLGQTLTRLDYAETREHRAQQVIDALAAYLERHQVYPDELAGLVKEGLLDGIPKPRIGLLLDQKFVFQNFGDSYLLEFSSPRWIQCAYNPPWQLEPGEEVDPEDAEALTGAWSCPQKPPEIW